MGNALADIFSWAKKRGGKGANVQLKNNLGKGLSSVVQISMALENMQLFEDIRVLATNGYR